MEGDLGATDPRGAVFAEGSQDVRLSRFEPRTHHSGELAGLTLKLCPCCHAQQSASPLRRSPGSAALSRCAELLSQATRASGVEQGSNRNLSSFRSPWRRRASGRRLLAVTRGCTKAQCMAGSSGYVSFQQRISRQPEVMMASPGEHRAEAERLLDIVRQAAGDDYQTAADQVPVLLAALVHATLGS